MTWRWIRRALALALMASTFACVFLASRPALAFPWMIREGYTGCNTCHADPSGAGILTQYGRGMEEVVIRMPYKANKDQDPGTLGNFAFGVNLPEQLLLQTDLRNLALTFIPNGGKAQFQDIVMQLDQSAQLKVGRFRLNGSIGYAPPSAANGQFTGGGLGATLTDAPGSAGALVARQYWMGFDIGKDEEFLLRVGRMNVPYGIRFVEHPFMVRSVTRTDINTSQQHGITLSYSGEKLRGEIMAILGNYAIHGEAATGPQTLAVWDAPHERGASAYLEWMPSNHVAVGASALATYAALARTDLDPSLNVDHIGRYAYALHGRVSPVKALVVLAEADALVNSQPFTDGHANNHFGLAGIIQADLEVYQGIHIVWAGEVFDGHIHETNNPTYDTTTAVGWLGVWWFFAPHFDMRLDAVYSSGTSPGASPAKPGTSLLAQLHWYL